MTAEEWNARHPIGTPVVYVPNAAEPQHTLRTRTRSRAWNLGHGQPVVMVDFRSGGVALDHLIIDTGGEGMTTYIWSAVVQGEDKPVVKRRTTRVVSALPLDPQDAAATVFKWWLDDTADDTDSSNWDYEFGDPENTETCHVVIHEPADAAGCYEVHAERALTVRGYMAQENDAQRVLAVLAEPEASA